MVACMACGLYDGIKLKNVIAVFWGGRKGVNVRQSYLNWSSLKHQAFRETGAAEQLTAKEETQIPNTAPWEKTRTSPSETLQCMHNRPIVL